MGLTSAPSPAPPTTRGSRFGAFMLATILTFLWIWLLGFLLDDVGRMKPVSYQEFFGAGMPAELLGEVAEMDLEVRTLERSNVALKSETARLDTKNVIVSLGLTDSLSEYPAMNTSCMIAQSCSIENSLIRLRVDSPYLYCITRL